MAFLNLFCAIGEEFLNTNQCEFITRFSFTYSILGDRKKTQETSMKFTQHMYSPPEICIHHSSPSATIRIFFMAHSSYSFFILFVLLCFHCSVVPPMILTLLPFLYSIDQSCRWRLQSIVIRQLSSRLSDPMFASIVPHPSYRPFSPYNSQFLLMFLTVSSHIGVLLFVPSQ